MIPAINNIIELGKNIICVFYNFYKRHWPFIVIFTVFIGYNCFSSTYHALYGSIEGRYFFFFFRKLCFIFLLASLIALFFLNNKKERYIKPFFYIFIILVYFLQRFLILNFGRTIGPDVLLMIIETNTEEANGFISTFAISPSSFRCYLECGIGIVAIILVELLNKKHYKPFGVVIKTTISIICAVILLIGSLNIKAWNDLFKCKNTEELASWEFSQLTKYADLVTKILYATKGMDVARDEILLASQAIERFKNEPVICNNEDSLNIVFIIGESAIKNHYSLYGYNLDTTPYMLSEERKGNLVPFSDVVSPFNVTTPAVKNILSCNTLSKRENWADFPFVPYIFKRAGYDVYFWDNQKYIEKGAGFTFELNSFLYNDNILPLYSLLNDSCYKYDEDLVLSFIHAVEKKTINKHNLFMFHLMGQHIAFNARFPNKKEFNYFSKDSVKRTEPWITDSKKQSIADYDNATRYHDMVINKLFEFFRHTPTIMVYLSDHGEEVYDYRDNIGRKFDRNRISANMIEYQFEVPFFIWVSDKYKDNHPDCLKPLESCKDRPFITDITYNILFHLANIKTKYYHEQQDLIHHHYQNPKRLLTNEGLDCDIIRN